MSGGATSEILLAAVLIYGAEVPPEHSAGWLRRRLGLDASLGAASVLQKLSLDSLFPKGVPDPSGLAQSTTAWSRDADKIVAWAESAAERTADALRAHHLVGALLCAAVDGQPTGAQALLERLAAPVAQLKLDYLAERNRLAIADSERAFWRAWLTPAKRVLLASWLGVPSPEQIELLEQALRPRGIEALAPTHFGASDPIEWMRARVRELPLVLVLCAPQRKQPELATLTPVYLLRGVIDPAKFVPVLLPGATADDVPPELRHLQPGDARTPEALALFAELIAQRLAAPQPAPFTVRQQSLSDIPTDVDRLGLEPYVDAMAQFLLSVDTSPPLTLSIEGEWGSGKSSFLRQLGKKLEAGGKRVVRFNPWRHEKDETLWAAFAETFYDQALPRAPLQRKLAEQRVRKARLDWGELRPQLYRLAAFSVVFLSAFLGVLLIAGRVPSQAPWWQESLHHLGGIVASLAGAAWASGTVQKARELFKPFQIDLSKVEDKVDYRSKRTFLMRFQEDFKKVHDALVPEDRLFVFIDDLDRCEVPRAAELLQALNLMLPEDSRLITLLAIDREKVAAALAVRNEKLLPLVAPPAEGVKAPYDAAKAIEFGHAFLEKFIQLPFRMPRPNPEDVSAFVEHLLSRGLPSRAAAEQQRGPAQQAATPPQPQGKLGPAGQQAAQQQQAREQVQQQKPGAGERAREGGALVSADAPEVRDVLAMVAPALDHNPRRLLQFINLFRLQAHIAGAQGLLGPAAGAAAISVSQLGKLTALGLRWPQLVADIAHRSALLAELQRAALVEADADEQALSWLRRLPLLGDLLRHGLYGVAPDALQAHPASLAGVDASRLLQTWSRPRVAGKDSGPSAA